MADNPFADDRTLSPAEEGVIDEACNRFEGDWRAGPRPRVGDYLGDVAGPGRSILLRELLLLDIHYRRRAGEQPRPEEYLECFPTLDPLWLTQALQPPPGPSPDGAATVDVPPLAPAQTGPVPTTQARRIRCPHCHNPIQLVDTCPDGVLCPGCGSSFRLADSRMTSTVETTRPLGKFQLLERVGVGAFGAVWRARDTQLDRVVALKIPHAGLLTSPLDLERFHREARAAAQLRHPNILTVYEVATLGGLPVLVSQFVTGATLRDLLEVRRLPFREVACLMADVADALDYAHAQGLVHRDVKPANIMLESATAQSGAARDTSVETDGGKSSGARSSATATEASPLRPVVMDFGLALRQEAEVTMTLDGQILGTPAYMSPEQAAGRAHDVDPRSDVYSLGVVLYELLSGELPFRGSRQMIVHQVLHDEPKPPRRLNDRVPRDLETICLKALAKSPGRRFATAGALAADLRRFLRGEPILARPVGRVERLWRWCGRNRTVAGLLATVAVALLGGLVGITTQWLRAERHWARVLQQERARQERLAGLRDSCERLWAEGEKAWEQGDWENARLAFASALAKIETETEPGSEAGLGALRERVRGRLTSAAERQAQEKRRQQAARDVNAFRRLAGEVQFYAAGVDARGEQAPYYDPRQAGSVARKALDVAGRWGGGFEELPLPSEQAALKTELHDFLLLTAQARLACPGTPDAAETALALLERARLLGDPSPGYHRLRACCYQVVGDAKRAALEERIAGSLDESSTALDHFLLGEHYRTTAPDPANPLAAVTAGPARRELLDKAVRCYRLALEKAPSHYWARFQLGRCYLSLGRAAEAAAVLDGCVGLRQDSPWGHCAGGLALALSRRLPEARRHLERALALDPDFRPARLNLGLVYHLEKNYDAALTEYEKALQPPDDKRLALAAYYQGQLHLERGDYAEAVKAFDTVLRDRADFGPALLSRAAVHFARGQATDGVADITRFLWLTRVSPPGPKEAEACALRGRILRRLAGPWGLPARGHQAALVAARDQLDLARQLGPPTASVWEDLGAVLEQLGEPDSAVRAYGESLRLQPDSVPVLLLRGWACTQSVQPPDYAQAREAFRRAASLEPGNAEAHTGLGYVHALQGASVEALREADLALLHGSTDYLVLHNVACIHAALAAGPARAAEHEQVALAVLTRAVAVWEEGGRPFPSAVDLIRAERAFSASLRKQKAFKQLVSAAGP